MSLKQIRMSKNITQDELAKEIGVGRTAVAMWESGKTKPRADMLLKLAAVFGCTVDELLREDKQKEEKPA